MLTLSAQSPLSRGLLAFAAIVTSGTLFVGSATNAFAQGESYRLEAAGISDARVVIRDTLWNCEGTACTTSKISSRPTVVCASAARKLGKIDTFIAKGEALSAEDLAKCNESAK